MMRAALIAMALFLSSMIVCGPAGAQMVKVKLFDSQGVKVGRAILSEHPGGVSISLQAWNLSPGIHGFHIHALGTCEPPAFTTAGGHFNPEGKKHGLKNPAGPHSGDLPNLVVGPDGTAAVEARAPLVTLAPGTINSLLGREGSALVIHASPDDEQTDPAGNAGARIACGVISSK